MVVGGRDKRMVGPSQGPTIKKIITYMSKFKLELTVCLLHRSVNNPSVILSMILVLHFIRQVLKSNDLSLKEI